MVVKDKKRSFGACLKRHEGQRSKRGGCESTRVRDVYQSVSF